MRSKPVDMDPETPETDINAPKQNAVTSVGSMTSGMFLTLGVLVVLVIAAMIRFAHQYGEPSAVNANMHQSSSTYGNGNVTVLENTVFRGSIAVCVCGQAARMMPHFFHSFFESNTMYNFTLFYNLQQGVPVYNTMTEQVFKPAKYSGMSESEILHDLRHLFDIYKNVNIASVTEIKAKTGNEWKEMFGKVRLDRISQYEHVAHTILSMYSKYVACAQQIMAYEQTHSVQFQAVVYSREDIYFFQPMHLDYLLSNLRPHVIQQSTDAIATASNTSFAPAPASPAVPKINRNVTAEGSCDYLTKSCLDWGGLNMRFFVANREAGLQALGDKLSFYRSLYDSNVTIHNPEMFELAHIRHLGLQPCAVDIEDFPITAARHIDGDEFCFISYETMFECYPRNQEAFVKDKQCKSDGK